MREAARTPSKAASARIAGAPYRRRTVEISIVTTSTASTMTATMMLSSPNEPATSPTVSPIPFDAPLQGLVECPTELSFLQKARQDLRRSQILRHQKTLHHLHEWTEGPSRLRSGRKEQEGRASQTRKSLTLSAKKSKKAIALYRRRKQGRRKLLRLDSESWNRPRWRGAISLMTECQRKWSPIGWRTCAGVRSTDAAGASEMPALLGSSSAYSGFNKEASPETGLMSASLDPLIIGTSCIYFPKFHVFWFVILSILVAMPNPVRTDAAYIPNIGRKYCNRWRQ